MKEALDLMKIYLKDMVPDAHVSIRAGDLFNSPSYPSIVMVPDKSTYDSGFFVHDIAVICSSQSTDRDVLAERIFELTDKVANALFEIKFKLGFANSELGDVEYLGTDAIAQSVAVAAINMKIWTRKKSCVDKTNGEE